MATDESKRPHLAFALAGDDYLVPIESVRELIAQVPLTPLPGAPDWVRGVFNLRGSVVPLIDLGVKLGVGSAAPTARTCWMIVELERDRRRQLLALQTDEVREIVELGREDLFATPPAGIRAPREHLSGVVALGAGFGLVLDLGRVLQAGEPGLAGSPEGVVGR
jgi:purine-binding chemotaxis protein CheW